MNSHPADLPSVPAAARSGRTAPAELVACTTARQVRCRFADGLEVDAQIAAVGYDDPRPGDGVLAVVDDAGAAWVIGLVRAAARTPLDHAIEASEPSSGPVRVHDRRGRLLFEYDPARDRAVVHVPGGDLELTVPDGALRMHARDGVELTSDAGIALEASRVDLTAKREAGGTARVALQPGELSLVATVLTGAADRVEVIASRIQARAHRFESQIDRVRSVARVIDVTAGRIVERAKDVYREAEGLSQTRAGRLRMVAAKAVQIVGEDALLKARDRMKIKGERIHLA